MRLIFKWLKRERSLQPEMASHTQIVRRKSTQRYFVGLRKVNRKTLSFSTLKRKQEHLQGQRSHSWGKERNLIENKLLVRNANRVRAHCSPIFTVQTSSVMSTVRGQCPSRDRCACWRPFGALPLVMFTATLWGGERNNARTIHNCKKKQLIWTRRLSCIFYS